MTIYSGFSHKHWWFSIAMLIYQRVPIFIQNLRFTTWNLRILAVLRLWGPIFSLFPLHHLLCSRTASSTATPDRGGVAVSWQIRPGKHPGRVCRANCPWFVAGFLTSMDKLPSKIWMVASWGVSFFHQSFGSVKLQDSCPLGVKNDPKWGTWNGSQPRDPMAATESCRCVYIDDM